MLKNMQESSPYIFTNYSYSTSKLNYLKRRISMRVRFQICTISSNIVEWTHLVNQAKMISATFCHSVFTNSLHMSLYIARKYGAQLFADYNEWVLSLVNMFSTLNCTDNINWHLVIDFEETLYLIECILEFFKYDDAELFIKNMYNIIDIREEISESDLSNLYWFIVLAANPIKIWVNVIYIIKKLQSK